MMSCVDLTPEMTAMLAALNNGDPPDPYLDTEEWRQARQWGWVMRTGELSGTGSRHAPGERPRGMIPRGL